jgi:hypothetical protein
MSTSPLFEWLSSELTQRTTLELLQSRGTVRLALKNAGLEPRTLNQEQALVLIERVLPHELKVRGIADADAVCGALSQALRKLQSQPAGPESAESIFSRLARK